MDARHRRLYLEWCQSSPTTLGIGPPSGPFTQTFRLPIEFLYHRSLIFRDLIDAPPEELEVGHPRFVLPPSISPHTIEDFLIWSLSPSPQVDDLSSLSEVTNLGVFAQQYHIPALTNQITDSIRNHIASDEWTLEAAIVDAIYGAAPAGSPLREVVRAALGKLPRLTGDSGAGGKVKGERDEWKEVILRHAQLGWDFIEAGGERWSAQGYLSGVCRFHDHESVTGTVGQGMGAACDGCPFAGDDCFPVVEGRGAKDDATHAAEPVVKSDADDVDEPESEPADTPVQSAVDVLADTALDDARSSPTDGLRVGNSIMVSDSADDKAGVSGTALASIDEGDTEPAGESATPDSKPEPSKSAVTDAGTLEDAMTEPSEPPTLEEIADEPNGTITSDDLVDEPMTPEPTYNASNWSVVPTSTLKEAGTMTEAVNGTGEELKKLDGGDAEAKLSKSKSKKKKKRGNSVSVGA